MIIDDDDMLTDEEKEVLKEDDTAEASAEEDVEEVSEQASEGASDESEESADTGDEDESHAQEAAEETAEEEVEEEEEEPDPGRVAPVFTADLSEDIPEQLENLEKLYSEGELETVHFLRERDKLIAASLRADIMADLTEQTAAHAWDDALSNFLDSNPTYNDPILAGALVAAYQQEDFVESHQGKSYAAILRDAQVIVDKRLNLTQEKEVEKSATEEELVEKKKVALKGRGKQADNLPQTLGDVPAASESNEKGKYSHIEGLEGLELEDALNSMSESDQEKWLASYH